MSVDDVTWRLCRDRFIDYVEVVDLAFGTRTYLPCHRSMAVYDDIEHESLLVLPVTNSNMYVTHRHEHTVETRTCV